MGAGTLHALWKERGSQGLDDEEQVVKRRQTRERRGFDTKKNVATGQGIEPFPRRPELMTRPRAEAVLKHVRKVFPEGGYAVAGGYRRGTSTLDRIVIVTTADQKTVMHRLPAPTTTTGNNNRRISFSLDDASLDVWFTDPDRYGTALLCATGSRGFLVRLSAAAREQGYRLEPEGLVEVASSRLLTFEDEEEVFAFLGMEAIPPELREDRGEVDLALSQALPDLVDLPQVRGDLHVHTTWSDGHQSLEDVAAAGDALGYEYIAITDHSSRMSPGALARQQAEIERVNRRHTCRLLAGCEVDIRDNGVLGYPDRVLADLDLVIASVHTGFDQDLDVMTRRVLAAMENEHVDIIGHPTGRLLGRRPPCAIDLCAVIEHAARTRTALEINASPRRLDLEDIYIWHAKKKGVNLAAGTDAHRAGEFSNMRYGMMLARRGWCTPDDILNTRLLSDLLEWRS